MNHHLNAINFFSRKIFGTFSGQLLMIDPNTVAKINTHFSVIEEWGEDGRPEKWADYIQIIYTNGASDELPKTEENMKMVQIILDEKSKKSHKNN